MNHIKMKAVYLVIVSCMALPLFSGCASARFTTTMKQKSLAPSELADHKLKIVSVTVNQLFIPGGTTLVLPAASAAEYMHIAMERYPAIFSMDANALPVTIRLQDESQSATVIVPIITSILSLGTLPCYPIDKTMQVKSELFFSDPTSHEFCVGNVRFERTDTIWLSVYTPFGLIPVPGKSDVPKVSGVIFGFSGNSSRRLTMISTVDAVVQAALDCGIQAFNKIKKEH